MMEAKKINDCDKTKRIFQIGDEYELGLTIGEGAYGVVCSAQHVPSSKMVAIKKVSPFLNSLFALRTLREIRILRFFDHENIVRIIDIIQPESFESFKDVYIIQDLMETDLHRVIRSQKLTDDHCQYFIYQILRAVKYLHSANIIHRDLKPSNLLVNSNCDLKICDFGLSRSISFDPSTLQPGFMTEYVATRWYRAPEIMLTFKQYDKAIDMWSVGCILSELLNGTPLFPGLNYHVQLSLIFDVTGTPSGEDLKRINSVRARNYISKMPWRPPTSLAILHPNASEEAINLLTGLLQFNPIRRLTATDALEYLYLDVYHDPEDEPISPPIPESLFPFDKLPTVPTIEELKFQLWTDIFFPQISDPNMIKLPKSPPPPPQSGLNSFVEENSFDNNSD